MYHGPDLELFACTVTQVTYLLEAGTRVVFRPLCRAQGSSATLILMLILLLASPRSLESYKNLPDDPLLAGIHTERFGASGIQAE